MNMKKILNIKQPFTQEKLTLLRLELENTRLSYDIDESLNIVVIYGDANDVRQATIYLNKCGLEVL